MADGIDFGEDDGSLDIPEGLADRVPQYEGWASDNTERGEKPRRDGSQDNSTSSWEVGWVQTFGGRGADAVQARRDSQKAGDGDSGLDEEDWHPQAAISAEDLRWGVVSDGTAEERGHRPGWDAADGRRRRHTPAGGVQRRRPATDQERPRDTTHSAGDGHSRADRPAAGETPSQATPHAADGRNGRTGHPAPVADGRIEEWQDAESPEPKRETTPVADEGVVLPSIASRSDTPSLPVDAAEFDGSSGLVESVEPVEPDAPAEPVESSAPENLFGSEAPENRTAWLRQFGGEDGSEHGQVTTTVLPRPRPPQLSRQAPADWQGMETGVVSAPRQDGGADWQPPYGETPSDLRYDSRSQAFADDETDGANGTAVFAMAAAVMAVLLGMVPALGVYLFPIPMFSGIVAGAVGLSVARRQGGAGRAVARNAIIVSLVALVVTLVAQAALVALGIVSTSVSGGMMTLTFSF